MPPSPTAGGRPVMATMAALAGMSSAAVATAPRLGNHRNRNALHDREQGVPLRSVRNSVSWDDSVKQNSSTRLKQLNEQYPPLLNES